MTGRVIYLTIIFVLIAGYFAMAQRSVPREAAGYLVVAVCGTLPAPVYVAGSYQAATIDVNGKFCVSQ
jgi:hypothetical protein